MENPLYMEVSIARKITDFYGPWLPAHAILPEANTQVLPEKNGSLGESVPCFIGACAVPGLCLAQADPKSVPPIGGTSVRFGP